MAWLARAQERPSWGGCRFMAAILVTAPPFMLVLASASPARRRLLEQAGIAHRVRVSGVDESSVVEADPGQLVQRLAVAKAEAVAAAEGEAVAVLGCDSVLVVEGEVYGKPRDREEAIARWLRMAGGEGVLYTGHALLQGMAETRLAVVSTTLAFAAVDRPEIEAYVASGEPLRCAGGFALEGRGGLFVERIEGCFSNVIGLSLPLLRRWLSC
jgi:septum formation protein